MVTGPFLSRVKEMGCDDYSHLSNTGVQINGAKPLFPLLALWHGQGQLNLYYLSALSLLV